MKCAKRLFYNGTQSHGTSSSSLRYNPYQRSSTSSTSTNDASAPLTESSKSASSGKKKTSSESVFSFAGEAEHATGQADYAFFAPCVESTSAEGGACFQGTSSPLPPVPSTPVASSPGMPAASSCLLQCPPLGSDEYHQPQFPAPAALSSFHQSYPACAPGFTQPPLPNLSGAAAAFPFGHDGGDNNIQHFASIALATGASNSAGDDKKKPARTYERRLEVQATGPSDFRLSAITMITVELCEFEFWNQLAKNDTKMIVTKAGR